MQKLIDTMTVDEELKNKVDKIQDLINYFKIYKPNNSEQEESLRQIFKDETKKQLWSENGNNDCGFSEEYVFWLERKLIEKYK